MNWPLLLLLSLSFWCHIQELPSNPKSWNFSNRFFYQFNSFKSYISGFDTIGANFHLWYKVRVQCHSFACGCLVSKTICCKDCPSSIQKFWHPVKTFDCIFKDLFLGSLFYFIDLYVFLHIIHVLFWLL